MLCCEAFRIPTDVTAVLREEECDSQFKTLLPLLSALLLLQPPPSAAAIEGSSLISAPANSKFGVVDFKGVRNADVSDLDK